MTATPAEIDARAEAHLVSEIIRIRAEQRARQPRALEMIRRAACGHHRVRREFVSSNLAECVCVTCGVRWREAGLLGPGAIRRDEPVRAGGLV